MAGPLAGLRVLDATQGAAAAITTMLLGDYGAEVIKLEPPVPAPAAHPARPTWDRGKKSIIIDSTQSDDLVLIRSLAEAADVVVVDPLTPTGVTGWQVDAAAVRGRNPGVVHVSFDGLGPSSAPDEVVAKHDILAAARLGVFAESPGYRDGPIYPGHSAITYGTAFIGLLTTLASLRKRLWTGDGASLVVSFEDGVLSQMTMNWQNERAPSFITYKGKTGALDLGRRRLLLKRMVCSDGWVQFHTGANGAFGRAMEALGIADRISPADVGVETASELTDDDLALLDEALPKFFRERTMQDVCELFWKHEVACLPILPPGAAFRDDQVVHAGVVSTVADPDLGPIEIVGPVIAFSATPGAVKNAAPARDADGDAIRHGGWCSAGFSDGAETKSRKPLATPLEGVRVVEMGVWFASPYGNRILAELGADVIKVETIAGDPQRPLPDPFEGANRGKRAISINLKDDAARDVVTALLRSADVVQHNMRPGAAERLGIGYDDCLALNPRVVYAYSPGFGSTGPKSQLQSFAPLVGGMTGLMHLFAGDGNPPHTGFGNEDYYNGMMSAASILMAVICRERGGPGQFVEIPQLHSSLLAASEWYVKDGVAHSGLPLLNRAQTGVGPFNAVYQCLIGWLVLAVATDTDRQALLADLADGDADTLQRLNGLLASAEPETLESEIGYQLTARSAEEWCERLRAAGVPCAVVVEESWLQAFLSDSEQLQSGRVAEFDHPVHGRTRIIGRLFQRHDLRHVDGPAPSLGMHTGEVLGELHLHSSLPALVERGAARSGE